MEPFPGTEMGILDICIYPDPVLREKAHPVENVDGVLIALLDNMVETMYKAPGIGLAANQVGQLLRAVVIDTQKEDDGGLITLINPEIVSGEGEIIYEEGCLSVPEFYANVKRHERICVRALDRDANPVEIEAAGLLAVVMQHEIDHLEGRLFVDHIGAISRDIFKRRWKKKLKEEKD